MTFPLAPAQRAVLVRHRRDAGGHRHSSRRAFDVRGPLDVAGLRAAAAHLVARHEPLRTAYVGDAQLVRPEGTLPVDVVREPPRPAPFDLAHGPLARVAVRELGPDHHEVTFFLHLLAADGWSLAVFFADLADCYRAELGGTHHGLRDLPVQYVDWAAWDAARRAGTAGRAAGWPAELDGLRRGGPGDRVRRGRVVRTSLGAALLDRVRALTAARGRTPFTALAGAAALTLSDHDRVLLGLAVADREQPETEPLMGFFATLVPLPVDLRGDPPFTEVLDRVARARDRACGRPRISLDDVPALAVDGYFAHHPAGSIGALRLHGCEVRELWAPDAVRFERMIRVREDDHTVVFEHEAAQHPVPESVPRSYRDVLHRVVEDPDAPVSVLRGRP